MIEYEIHKTSFFYRPLQHERYKALQYFVFPVDDDSDDEPQKILIGTRSFESEHGAQQYIEQEKAKGDQHVIPF